MKYWDRIFNDLKDGDHTLRSIYDIISTRFTNQVFAETLKGATINKLTYGELVELVDTVFGGLGGFDLKKGDIVGIDMPNSPLWVACFWGILKAGYRPLLVNTIQDAATKEKVIDNCKCALVLSDGSSVLKNAADCSKWKKPDELPAEDWSDEFVLSTTGTTGVPKTVVHNGKGILAQILISQEAVRRNKTTSYNSRGEMKFVAFLPFCHIFGLVSTLLWFSVLGRPFVFLSDNKPDTIRYACKRHEPTHFFAIPLVWNSVAAAVLKEADRTGQRKKLEKALKFTNGIQKVFPFLGMKIARAVFKKQRSMLMGTKLMFLVSGGAPLSADARRVLNGMGYSIYNGYGSTEAGIVSVELSPNVKHRLGESVGHPFDSVDAKIKDGMLVLNGGGMYVATVKDGEIIPRDESEYFETNDNAEIDGDGRLYIRGRRDDVIITANGENVNPEDLEEKIGALPCDTYCVCGLKRDGKTINALVLGCPDDERRPYAVSAAFAAIDKLPQAVRPQTVYLCERLPVMLGKIRRSELRDMFADTPELFIKAERANVADLKGMELSLADAVRGMFADVLKTELSEVKPNSDFFELGGTSLDYFTLLSTINEKYRVALDMTSDVMYVTPASFAVAISEEMQKKVG